MHVDKGMIAQVWATLDMPEEVVLYTCIHQSEEHGDAALKELQLTPFTLLYVEHLRVAEAAAVPLSHTRIAGMRSALFIYVFMVSG